MIEKTDAWELFTYNLNRTNMLLEAIDKIRAYNRLYQMEQTDREYLKMVEKIQAEQFVQIQQSCGEHAIISLATSFETYYKELLQQLLIQFPDHFTARLTKYSTKLTELVNSEHPVNYELIEAKLKLCNRFDYYDIFKAYNIKFLSPDEDNFIEYIYLKRNNYVHNAGRLDTKTKGKLEVTSPPYNGYAISTEAKRLRTKLKRVIYKLHNRIITGLCGDGS